MSFTLGLYGVRGESCGNCGNLIYDRNAPCPKCGSMQRVMSETSPILDLIIKISNRYKRQKMWLKILIPVSILFLGASLFLYSTATPGSIFTAVEIKNAMVNPSEVEAFFTITNIGKKPGISHCVVTVYDNYGGNLVDSKPVYHGVIQPGHTYSGSVLILIPNGDAANEFNGIVNC